MQGAFVNTQIVLQNSIVEDLEEWLLVKVDFDKILC